MSREEVFEKLTEVFIDVFDDEDITINDSTTSSDIEGWDSLAHITLIGVVEDEFGIKFDMDTLSDMKNVGKMVDLIQEKLG